LVSAAGVQCIAQSFFDPKQIALTVLGNLENCKIGREDLADWTRSGETGDCAGSSSAGGPKSPPGE